MAFQKILQKYGRMAFNFEVYCPTDCGYLESLARGRSSEFIAKTTQITQTTQTAKNAQNAQTTVQNLRTTRW